MIEITLSTKDFTVIVKGHALPEETPLNKEICASASMLVQGLAHSLAKFEYSQNGILQFDYRGDPGDLMLHVIPAKWAEAATRKRMRTYADGMELLARSNPESVRMIWDGEPVKPEEGENEDE